MTRALADVRGLPHGIIPHTATHCNTLQHSATHGHTLQYSDCNTLQRTATRCNTLQHTMTRTLADVSGLPHGIILHSATLCNTLQHSATLCNTLTTTCCNTSQRLQHIATYHDLHSRRCAWSPSPCYTTLCNTLQHSAIF